MQNTSSSDTDSLSKANNLPTLNWRGITSSVKQHIRRSGMNATKIDISEIIGLLKSIADLTGSYSIGRKKLFPIAKALLNPERTLICPICLDSADLRSPTNLPAIVLKHQRFLDALIEKIGKLRVVMLIPTHDYVGQEVELVIVMKTIVDAIASRGWVVSPMTEFFPDIKKREDRWAQFLEEESGMQNRLQSLASMRTKLYDRRAPGTSTGARVSLTARTSAQYLALGELVAERSWFVCNQTTLNLMWYGKSGAALLHNPVLLYS